MSLTSQIGSSDVTFKLAQKLVSALAEKFAFSFEDGWNTVSARTIENIQKRIKREKRKANPASALKHARTAFSFYTQRQRPISQAAHPKATFGELSRFVSEAWKALTPAQMAEFKDLETADKGRYQAELATVRAATPAASEAVAVVESSETAAAPVKEKKAKKAATPKAAPATTEASVTPAPKAPKAEKVKTPKAEKAPKVEVAATPAPVAEAKAAKAPKAKKEAAPAAPVAATPAPVKAAPAPVKAAAAPKAASAPKAKAVKA